MVSPAFSQRQDRSAGWSARPACRHLRSSSPSSACYSGALSRSARLPTSQRGPAVPRGTGWSGWRSPGAWVPLDSW